jgi:hypothetical protein
MPSQRTALPGRHLRQHAVGHRADEGRADVGGVGFREVALDLAHRQAARVQRHDLVVEAGEATRVFGDQQRVETAVTVAWCLNPHPAVAGDYGFGRAAVAMVG